MPSALPHLTLVPPPLLRVLAYMPWQTALPAHPGVPQTARVHLVSSGKVAQALIPIDLIGEGDQLAESIVQGLLGACRGIEPRLRLRADPLQSLQVPRLVLLVPLQQGALLVHRAGALVNTGLSLAFRFLPRDACAMVRVCGSLAASLRFPSPVLSHAPVSRRAVARPGAVATNSSSTRVHTVRA